MDLREATARACVCVLPCKSDLLERSFTFPPAVGVRSFLCNSGFPGSKLRSHQHLRIICNFLERLGLPVACSLPGYFPKLPTISPSSDFLRNFPSQATGSQPQPSRSSGEEGLSNFLYPTSPPLPHLLLYPVAWLPVTRERGVTAPW